MPYVTDTHSLIWHMTGDTKLSAKAKAIFENVDSGQDSIFIPCIVFFELFYLIEKKRIIVDFDNFISTVSASKNYKVEPLCLSIIKESRAIPKEMVSDPWDRIIAATSIYLGFPLITRDKSLRKIGLKTIW